MMLNMDTPKCNLSSFHNYASIDPNLEFHIECSYGLHFSPNSYSVHLPGR